MGDLSPHFSRVEFTCKCGCGFCDVSDELIAGLEKIRDVVGEGVYVNSGCRCKEWNERQGGVENSAHLRGTAADIRLGYYEGPYRYRLLSAAFLAGFKRIGVADTFIHVDVDRILPSPSAWVY